MVVIEPEVEEEETVQPPPPPKPRPASSSNTTADSSSHVTAAATAAPEANGNDSDGFETASERGVSDNEEEEENEQGHHEPRQPEEDAPKEDDQSEQRAVERANEAKMEGNQLFGKGQYEEALLQYDAALQSAPENSKELRSICHSNRAICLLKLGKYDDAIKECTKALELNPSYIKALLRRGEAHEKLEHFEEAIADMKKVLELDPSNDQARKSIRRLEPLAEAKREKMKEEMIAKLKDMGNSVLGRFGMSVDNFKAVKDPNTGSYSISFQR
ncbi:hypothetical protein Tsubulata_006218 [Turnera subulata]|uniref:Tetratricopeptide repeat protein 1 n=1 Tax=Turnera subulata TaxID=218843 RepID=A0A9Q0J868_9ROSI|nr:hypothetical protein Tsubulata_006218 [Turnera subulata]